MTTTITMPAGKSVLYRLPKRIDVQFAPNDVRPAEQNTLVLVKPTIIAQREAGATTAPATAR